ncbi:MAG TPA: hypothetical protein VLV86_03635 [Vicinamibacterales bacterium]|nr:hypothetical protein [Vicinamibacterales bacterium]
MWDFLESIENSGFSTYIRETPSVLGYSTVLALHTFGMAFLVGLSGVIALRVLGIIPELPMKPLKNLNVMIVVGFWVNAITGAILTSLAIRSLLTNWDFYVKLAAIACALVSLVKMRRYAFGDPAMRDDAPASADARRWAKLMLFFWFLAVLGGRLTAYATYIRIQSAEAVGVAAILLLLLASVLVRHANRSRSAEATRARASAAEPVTSTR